MNFKRIGSKPFGVQFNKAEQKIIDHEIDLQLVARFREYEMDNDAAILEMLHDVFGFGKKRLKRAWKQMYVSQQKLCDYYEMPREDGGWLSRKKLAQIGVDLEAWYKEEQEGQNEISGERKDG